jgi:hypothetical protein
MLIQISEEYLMQLTSPRARNGQGLIATVIAEDATEMERKAIAHYSHVTK